MDCYYCNAKCALLTSSPLWMFSYCYNCYCILPVNLEAGKAYKALPSHLSDVNQRLASIEMSRKNLEKMTFTSEGKIFYIYPQEIGRLKVQEQKIGELKKNIEKVLSKMNNYPQDGAVPFEEIYEDNLSNQIRTLRKEFEDFKVHQSNINFYFNDQKASLETRVRHIEEEKRQRNQEKMIEDPEIKALRSKLADAKEKLNEERTKVETLKQEMDLAINASQDEIAKLNLHLAEKAEAEKSLKAEIKRLKDGETFFTKRLNDFAEGNNELEEQLLEKTDMCDLLHANAFNLDQHITKLTNELRRECIESTGYRDQIKELVHALETSDIQYRDLFNQFNWQKREIDELRMQLNEIKFSDTFEELEEVTNDDSQLPILNGEMIRDALDDCLNEGNDE